MNKESFPVSIDGNRLLIDLQGYIRRPVGTIRDTQDQGAEPSEATLAPGFTWKRSQTDFIEGAGQTYFDQEDDRNRRRFRSSQGIDCWDRRELKLLNETTAGSSITGTGAAAGMIRAGSDVYAFAGGVAQQWDGTSWNAMTGESGTFSSICTIGGYVYYAGSAALRRCTVGATALSAFGSLTPDIVYGANGRLIAGEANVLYEVDNAGVKFDSVDIFTHEQANFAWKRFTGAPNGIYAVGDDGVQSTIYLIGVIDATGALNAPYSVGELPIGEIVNDIVFYGGVLIMATTKGVRLATINASGFLAYGPLLDDVGDCSSITVDGSYAWVAMNADPINGYAGLARLGLSIFTATLIPSWAPDIYTVDTGSVLACESLGGKRVFLYDDGANVVPVSEASTKVAIGYFNSGHMSYGTPEDKEFWGLDTRYEALPAGSGVISQLAVGGVLGEQDSDFVVGSTAGQVRDLAPITGELAEIWLQLYRATDTTVSPVVNRWTMRSTPTPFRTHEIILPVLLREAVVDRNRQSRIDPYAVWQAINTLAVNRNRVDMVFGDRTETVIVDAILNEPTNVAPSVDRWNKERGWPEGTYFVRCYTQES